MAGKKKTEKPINQLDQWQTPEKRTKGKGVFYDEAKSEKIHIALTPTAKNKLTELANSNGLSVSEFLERWLRGFLDEARF
jgi:hypothetical protein